METQDKIGLDEKINEAFQPLSSFWEGLILHEFFGTGIPTIIFLLVGGAAFFTFYFGFINIRGFGLSLKTVMGRYDSLDEKRSNNGEVSHFQALATAVSGTVGNGNIAGVAMAIAIGGPGATFWMILCGLLGMSSKFVECTLGVKYRDVGSDGTVYGGPMYYLSKGLKERGFAKLGKVLAVTFAILCIGASFGGGNAAQSNQAALQMVSLFGISGGGARTMIGIIMMIVVGIIIIGGIKRIASVTEKIVPFMAGIYVLACLYIIFSNLSFVDDAFAMIINQAFAPSAAVGGFIGVLVQGFRRGAFEGSTAVMVRGQELEGAGLTSAAFSEYISFSGPFLALAVVLFALSTMISWSYYGLQSWMYVFGKGKVSDLTYKILFLIFIVIGAAGDMSSVWAFSDAMILALVFPNMIGLFILFPKVREELQKYINAISAKKSS